MAIRLEVEIALDCRPKRGERRHKDGRLVRSYVITASTLEECLEEARASAAAGDRIAPGYAKILEVRAYDHEAYMSWVREGGDKPAPLHTNVNV